MSAYTDDKATNARTTPGALPMTARQEGVKQTLGRAQICGQFGDRTFMCIGRDCVAKFDHGDANLPHAENAAYAALAWNAHSQLTGEVARLSALVATMQPVVNAASIWQQVFATDDVYDEDGENQFDADFELDAAVLAYRTALGGGA